MDSLAGMQLFVRVVETGSFSRAAAALGTTQPTATKAVAAAEKRLGARLLHRTTRGVTPTEVGALYYERCKLIVREVEAAGSLATLRQGAVGGTLRISTSVAFGRRVMVPLVLRYMREQPHLTVDLSFDDRYVNLVEQGVDVAMRMGRLADSSLGARWLGTNPWVMVAAETYLAQHGEPKRARDLARHTCLVYSSVQGDDRWMLTGPDGREQAVPVRGPLRSNNLSAILAAARAGMGLAILPRYVARESLAERAVQEVMADHRLPAQDLHAVFPSPKLVPLKVSHFIDWLKEALHGDWWARDLAGRRGGR
ncbi:MAG: LysR family transcriptional regulator [Betaproteobacteria bacterium]|nr:LysR family transcriptional regulator [Betaproteobacteria bacterium]MCC6248004.1 LysR family transcriptional regulator [Rubrivivax sp.]